jgi:alkylation response protein AidB-like acyl-CoA dehydrogenase
LIDLEPDDEQALVIETVRQFAANELRPRAREADEAGKLPREVLDLAHELGLVANVLPEALGGSGERSAITGALIAEELAWGDLAQAVAILSPALLALPLLDGGGADLHQQLLPGLAGKAFVPGSLALAEPRFDSDPFRPRTQARREADDWILEGPKCLVPWIEGLQTLVVTADTGEGTAAFVIPADAPGLTAERTGYMGLRALPLAELGLVGVRVDPSARLELEISSLVARGQVGVAALGVGLARAAYELALDYAKQRETFGAPIATRQSIAFMLADMATEIDGLRLLVWEAAWCLDRDMEAGRAAALAIGQARRVLMQVADGAVQVFGGHGYTREYLPEMLLRNAAGFASFDALTLI